jgi:hypothetical protein
MLEMNVDVSEKKIPSHIFDAEERFYNCLHCKINLKDNKHQSHYVVSDVKLHKQIK